MSKAAPTPDHKRLAAYALNFARSDIECYCPDHHTDQPETVENRWYDTGPNADLDDFEREAIADAIWVLKAYSNQLQHHAEHPHLVRFVAPQPEPSA